MIERSLLWWLTGVAGVASLGLVPSACGGGDTSGGGAAGAGGAASSAPVGAPCVPGDEMSPQFGGFRVVNEVIEPGSPSCGSAGVCLVNHFQGAVFCPLGQPAPKDAQGLRGCVPDVDASGQFMTGQGSCAVGKLCIQAGSVSPACDPSKGAQADQACAAAGAGAKCGAAGLCECATDSDCAFATEGVVACDAKTHQCMAYGCHKPGACQSQGSSPPDNAGEDCCVPGSDVPILEPICGQCRGFGGNVTRDADRAVYCSCRCGVADGAPDEPLYPFCACPAGFECSEIRPSTGLGDPTLSGKYCIQQETAYDANKDQCGLVDGYWTSGADGSLSCAGAPSGECTTEGGPCNPN